MTDDSNLYLLLMTEVFMVVHLTGNKGICTLGNGIVQQECSCPTADGHLFDGALQQLVGLNASHAKALLHHREEIAGRHRFSQLAYHATGTLHITHGLLRTEEPWFLQTHLLRDLIVHAT